MIPILTIALRLLLFLGHDLQTLCASFDTNRGNGCELWVLGGLKYFAGIRGIGHDGDKPTDLSSRIEVNRSELRCQ